MHKLYSCLDSYKTGQQCNGRRYLQSWCRPAILFQIATNDMTYLNNLIQYVDNFTASNFTKESSIISLFQYQLIVWRVLVLTVWSSTWRKLLSLWDYTWKGTTFKRNVCGTTFSCNIFSCINKIIHVYLITKNVSKQKTCPTLRKLVISDHLLLHYLRKL